MGSGIAMCFVEKGIPVLMYDQSQDFLQRGVGMMKKKWESAVKKGKISEQQLQVIFLFAYAHAVQYSVLTQLLAPPGKDGDDLASILYAGLSQRRLSCRSRV